MAEEAAAEAPICLTCGNQAGPPGPPPEVCPICADERQYVRDDGWTTVSTLAANHRNEWRELEPGLYGFRAKPQIGIGPRSLFLHTDGGNILFDVNALPDEETVARIRELGGLQAIAASHPHFYGAMTDWSAAFQRAPILLPAADRDWALRRDGPIEWWEDEREVFPDVRLIQCGGHFDGSAILHWGGGAEGRGVLLTGDTIMITPATPWMSFMRSYPNYLPLPVTTARRVADRALACKFDRVYGNPGWDKYVADGAREALIASIARYERWLTPRR